jgi:hypothetical protein
MFQRAALDLDSSSPRARSSAYYFLTGKDTTLQLWCQILGVTPDGVRNRLRKQLRKFELDTKKGGATIV